MKEAMGLTATKIWYLCCSSTSPHFGYNWKSYPIELEVAQYLVYLFDQTNVQTHLLKVGIDSSDNTWKPQGKNEWHNLSDPNGPDSCLFVIFAFCRYRIQAFVVHCQKKTLFTKLIVSDGHSILRTIAVFKEKPFTEVTQWIRFTFREENSSSK